MENKELQNLTEIAKLVQKNNKEEASAIEGYTEMLEVISTLEIDEDLSVEIMETITEIISDELNHQEKLNNLYIKLTEIEPNKE